MTLIRKKIPKSGLVLLALVVVVLIALPILHFTGVYDMSFLGDYAIQIVMAGTTSGWIAAAIMGACAAAGFGICYILKDYIIGMEGNNLTVSNSGNQYQPLGANTVPNNGTVINS
jgi:hypothetical protein